MSKKRRFYQLTYPNTGKPVLFEDIGNTLSISGVLLQGMGLQALALLPSAEPVQETKAVGGQVFPIVLAQIVQPTLEEWSELIRQSDDPMFFELDKSGVVKAIHRKQRFAISGAVQQKIWARDDFRCMISGRRMGESPLSIDHWMPLELGGKNDETNYLSMTRKINKNKGNQHPKEWCEDNDVDYREIMIYLGGFIGIEELSHLKGKI